MAPTLVRRLWICPAPPVAGKGAGSSGRLGPALLQQSSAPTNLVGVIVAIGGLYERVDPRVDEC